VGRLQLHWKGEHRLEQTSQKSAQNNLNSLKYYLVKTVETDEEFKEKAFFSCVPTTWVSVCMKFMLYPPPLGHILQTEDIKNQINGEVMFLKGFVIQRKIGLSTTLCLIFNLKKPGKTEKS
jgi:hypothetical protein